jgi:hypothetical protein
MSSYYGLNVIVKAERPEMKAGQGKGAKKKKNLERLPKRYDVSDEAGLANGLQKLLHNPVELLEALRPQTWGKN